MTTVNPEGNSESLSLEEGIAAYTANPDNETETGQSASEEAQGGEEHPDDLETDGQDNLDEDQSDDEQEGKPETPAYATPDAKVKMPDGSEVTVDALVKGNLLERDYRQKTARLAETERSYVQRSEQFQQLETRMAEDRQFMEDILSGFMPQRPDPAMAGTDPVGFMQATALFDQQQRQLDHIVKASQEAQGRKAQAEQQQTMQIKAREWDALTSEMPELKDQAKLSAFVGRLQKTGQAFGFTPQDMTALAMDHRMTLVLRAAGELLDLRANKSRVSGKVQGRPPVSPGTRQPPQLQKARDVKVAMDRLSQTGSFRDGVAAYMAAQRARAG